MCIHGCLNALEVPTVSKQVPIFGHLRTLVQQNDVTDHAS